MKRVLLLIAVVFITLSGTAQRTDTLYNKGDGKMIIIDQRPRTIVRNPTPLKTEPIYITVTVMDTPKPIPQPTPVVNYPYYKTMEDIGLSMMIIGGLFLAILLMYSMFKKNNTCVSCDHKEYQVSPPVVNHFHVSGGNSNAIVDGSETLSNYQNDTHYHKHIPSFAGFFGNKPSEPKPAEEQKV